jgi:hypothetical protein
MSWLTRVMALLVRCLAAALPADRRGWAHALRAEAEQVPAGWARLAWLAGGVRLTALAARPRRLGYPVMFAVAAAGLAWSAWSGPPGDPAIVINRVDAVTVAVILAGLTWTVRRARGPAADARPARLVRAGGYLAVLALVLVKAAVERVADAPPNNLGGSALAWTGEIVFLAAMAGYAAVILAGTARRSAAACPDVVLGAVMGAAVGIGIYALGPLGFPLRFTGLWPARLYDAAMVLGAVAAGFAPVVAGLIASRRAGRAPRPADRIRSGATAGLCTGASAALVVSVLSTATIALLPHDAGLRDWAVGHIGQWTPAVGQVAPLVGTRLGYVAGNSAFAAGYLIVLLLSPLGGGGLGAWAGWTATRPRLAVGR